MSLTVGQISTVCQGKSQTALAFGTYCTFACKCVWDVRVLFTWSSESICMYKHAGHKTLIKRHLLLNEGHLHESKWQ